MITKQNILDRLNEIIENEGGISVTVNDSFKNAELDSLGSLMVLVNLDIDFNLFSTTETEDVKDQVTEFIELTVREIINKCRLAIQSNNE